MDKDIMKCFIGKVIKVDRGGPESKIGMLMDASDDLIVLLTEDDGLVYYNSKHMKSFTDNIKGNMKLNIEVPKDFKFIKADNFKELLDSLKFKWIKINRGGPEKLEGVLTEVDNDFVFLINNQEIVRLSLIHIKSISYGLKIEKAKEEKKSNKKCQNKNKKTNSKKGTSQKTTAKDAKMALAYPLSSQETVVEEVESELAIPLSTMEASQETLVKVAKSEQAIPLSAMEASQETAVEEAENELAIPLFAMEASQETAVENSNDDLSVLLSSLEKFLRKYSATNQN